jgi:hypothetical protein
MGAPIGAPIDAAVLAVTSAEDAYGYFEEGTRRVRRPQAGGLGESARAILTPPLRRR